MLLSELLGSKTGMFFKETAEIGLVGKIEGGSYFGNRIICLDQLRLGAKYQLIINKFTGGSAG